MPPMRLVCFDLGGVLVRITLNVAEAARRSGVRRFSAAPELSFADLPFFLQFQAGILDERAYLAEFSKFGGSSVEEAKSVHNHILIEPYPGTLELIRDLRAEGLQTACLSNTNALHWQEMLYSGRFPNVAGLDVHLASHERKLEKPDPRFYREMEMLTGVEAAEVVFFDDGLANVQAARACGWYAEHIDPEGDPAKQMRAYLGR